MDKKITIAVDAMGGDGSPKKIIDGINYHSQNANNVKYLIFGNKDIIDNYIPSTLNNILKSVINNDYGSSKT